MGLRDFLTGTQQLQEGAKQYGDAASEIRKQAFMDDFNKSSPQILGDLSSKDQAIKNAAIQKIQQASQFGKVPPQMEAAVIREAVPKTAGLGEDQINTMSGFTPEQKKMAASLAGDEIAQKRYMDQVTGMAKANQTEYGRNSRHEDTMDFRSQAMKGNAVKELQNTEKQYIKEKAASKEITDLMDNGNTVTDNAMSHYIARAIVGDKGPIREQELQRIASVVGAEGTYESLMAHVTGKLFSTMTPEVRKQLQDIVTNRAKNIDSIYGQQAAGQLANAHSNYQVLQNDDGTPGKTLSDMHNRFKKMGLPINYNDKTMTYEYGVGTNSHTGDKKALIDAASAITDPNAKAQFLKYLNDPSKNFNEDQVAHIMQKIKAASAGGQ